MGEADCDQQRVKKMAAAAAYDYEGDPRWAEDWSNVLIPPHMASRSDVVDHFKRKFYQRFIDPDFVFEPMTSTGTFSQSAGPSVRSSSSSVIENARPRSSGGEKLAKALLLSVHYICHQEKNNPLFS